MMGAGKDMKRFLAMAIGIALLTAACSDPTAPTPPTPVAPTITETFTGTLVPAGFNIHRFVVSQVGGLKVTLNDVQPPAAITVSVGTPSAASGQCIALANLTAVASGNVQISGTATVSGNFCVSVSDDAGSLVESVSYTITVLHS